MMSYFSTVLHVGNEVPNNLMSSKSTCALPKQQIISIVNIKLASMGGPNVQEQHAYMRA